MKKEIPFSEIINSICERPSMYCLEGTFSEISAFINGYCSAKKTPISGRDFDRFVCLQNSFRTNISWESVIKKSTKNDKEALLVAKNTILNFIKLKSKLSKHKLMQHAMSIANINEDEAEKTFRKFDNAFFNGENKIIEELIIDKGKVEVLLSKEHPDTSFVKQFNELPNKMLQRSYESENGKKIKILVSDWSFSVEMVLKKSKWKVNATNLIPFLN